MKTALANRDIENALKYFTDDSRKLYNDIYSALYDHLPEIVTRMQDIQIVYAKFNTVKYRMRKDEQYGGQMVTITYYIYFVIDRDGVWKIHSY